MSPPRMRGSLRVPGALHDEERWQAVVGRSTESGEGFVYAVRSTGVFCRPSCPSRKPRRVQVRFFATPEEARRAGFRPCKRCRPEQPHAADAAGELVSRACRFIDACAEPPSLHAVGRAAGASPYHLHRTFKRKLGITPRQYADERRLERLKERLRGGEDIAGASFDVGYGSSSRLYESASARLGMTPGRYRAGGQDLTVRFAVVRSALGSLLVAATERGLCRVALGGSARELRARLRAELPRADLREDAAGLGTSATALVAYLDGERPWPHLPVDIAATAFSRRVFEALRDIPEGETRTYAEIADTIGHPGGARAVGRACARNPVALAIPCHRAVRSDGAPGGYRYGPDRKRKLLTLEQRRSKRC